MELNKNQFGNSGQGPAEWEKFLMNVKPGEPTPAPKGGVYRNRKDSKVQTYKIDKSNQSPTAGSKDRWEGVNPNTGFIHTAKSKKAAVRKARKQK